VARQIVGPPIECPQCHKHTLVFDPYFDANVCSDRKCPYREPVDHSREWSKGELIALLKDDPEAREVIQQIALEVAIKVSRTHSGGQMIAGSKGGVPLD
jgi:hypothetical protein